MKFISLNYIHLGHIHIAEDFAVLEMCKIWKFVKKVHGNVDRLLIRIQIKVENKCSHNLEKKRFFKMENARNFNANVLPVIGSDACCTILNHAIGRSNSYLLVRSNYDWKYEISKYLSEII